MSSKRNALVEWKERCGLTSFAHHRVQAKFAKQHTILGVFLLICTTVTGTSSFVSLGENNALFQLLIIIFTTTSGVLAGIQTFLDYKTLGERHKVAASIWENLRWKAEFLLASTPPDTEIDENELLNFKQEVDEARIQSPTIHNNHWNKAVSAFSPSGVQ